MDTQRFIQVLQELINSQNNIVSSLNSYIGEAQAASFSSCDIAVYQALQEENNNLNSRINELATTNNQLQNDIFNLHTQIDSGTASSNAEIDSLRNLVSALTNDKDYLQSVVNSRDHDLDELRNFTLTGKDFQINELSTNVSNLQTQVTELNSRLSEAFLTLEQKQAELNAANEKVAALQNSVNTVKQRVAAELEEALHDIDQAIDENIR